jgi:hypothetical protein
MNLTQSGAGGLAYVDASSSAVGSAVLALTWPVARGATNTAIVGAIPANARILAIFTTVSVVSNAATTGTVSVGLSGGSATAFTAAQDVKTAIGNFSEAATASWSPTAAAQTINCTYTETGAASSAGTFNVSVLYTVL